MVNEFPNGKRPCWFIKLACSGMHICQTTTLRVAQLLGPHLASAAMSTLTLPFQCNGCPIGRVFGVKEILNYNDFDENIQVAIEHSRV